MNKELNIKTLTLGPLATNCYILSDDTAIVIDPAAEPDKILSELREVTLTHIIYTHAHWDHILAGDKLKKETDAEVILGEKELDLFNNHTANLNDYFDAEGSIAAPGRLVREGDRIVSGNITLKVIATPGHTPGGISLYVDEMLFCGDTVFMGSVGRTDFPGGSSKQLKETIRNKIITLDDNVRIYPGHGPATTVGYEKKNNPFFNL